MFGTKLQCINLNIKFSEDREEALKKECVVFEKKIRIDRTLNIDASISTQYLFIWSHRLPKMPRIQFKSYMGNMVMLGDFNFSFHPASTSHNYRPHEFMTFVGTYFNDCLSVSEDDGMLLTFRRSCTVLLCIDYIFTGDKTRSQFHDSSGEFVHPK